MKYDKKARKRYHLKKNNLRGLPRMIIHKTEKHLYVQVIDLKGKVLNSISSISEKIKGYNSEGAVRLAEIFREKIEKKLGREYVYDLCGDRYSGRISKFIEPLGFHDKKEKQVTTPEPIKKAKTTKKSVTTKEKITKKKGE